MNRMLAATRIGIGLSFLTMAALLPALALDLSPLRLVVFVTLAGFVLHAMYIRRILAREDASPIPERIQVVLDNLVEGVVILDGDQRIVLANHAFAVSIGQPASELVGRVISELRWSRPRARDSGSNDPWTLAVCEGAPQKGISLAAHTPDGVRTFLVNCAPILSARGHPVGAFAAFDDVTGRQQQQSRVDAVAAMLDTMNHRFENEAQDAAGPDLGKMVQQCDELLRLCRSVGADREKVRPRHTPLPHSDGGEVG